MAISKERKIELVSSYKEMIENSNAVFLAEYSGMDVKAMSSLREKVIDAGGKFMVTKNTLFGLALEETDRDVPEDLLLGQLGTGFALEEAPTLAKALVDFASKEENLELRGGFMDVRILTVEEIEALAKLPSLEVLRAQLLGLISTPAQRIAGVVAGSLRQVVNVVDAYAKSEEAGEED